MLVADWNDDRIYTYNMPAAADARLASLSLTGVEIPEFSSRRREYTGIPESGVRETTVAATAVQPSAMVALHPPAAGGDADNGHQVTISGGATITVTVTSPDGSRERVYRVHIEKTEEVVELTPTWTLVPWPGLDGVPIIEALRGAHPDLDITSHVVLIYHWDQASQTWRAFSPDLLDVPGPRGLATLTTEAPTGSQSPNPSHGRSPSQRLGPRHESPVALGELPSGATRRCSTARCPMR